MAQELEFKANRLPFDPNADDDDVAPRLNYVDLIIRYRWWLAAGALLGAIGGELAYLKAGPEYEAIGQVMVSRSNGVPLKEERSIGDFGERSEHIALLQSPFIIENAVSEGKLSELKTFRGDTDIVDSVIGGLKVKRSAGQDRSYLNVVNISFTSPSGPDAQRVVKAVIAAYSQYLAETRDEKTSEVFVSAQKSYDALVAELRERESEYHAFRDAAPLQWRAPVGANSPDGQVVTTNVHQERVTAVEEDRRKNLIRLTELESRIIALMKTQSEGAPRTTLEALVRRFLATDGPTGEVQQQIQEVTAFENRLLPLILEEQKLLRDYGADHSDVKAVRKSIQETLQFFRKHGLRMPDDQTPGPDGKPVIKPTLDIVALYIDSVKEQIKELKIRDEQLAAVFEYESGKAKEFARFQSKDQEMNAEVQRLQKVRDQLRERIERLKIDKDSSGYSLKQIAPVREELVFKRIVKFLGGGASVAVLAVACLCGFRELQDNKLKSVKEVRQLIQRPLLGSVGIFDPRKADFDNPLIPHPALRYLAAPSSNEAENYRSVRSALMVAAESRGAKVVEVSSPEPGDGKTTLTVNLALAFAQSGKRVILIDADLRRPTVHQLFGMKQVPGLAEVLAGEVEFANVIRRTMVEGLSLVTSGYCPANPAEALSSPRLAKILKEARDEFDFVFVDAPPLLAVSDPCVIARHTDGLLLTVRIGKNRRPVIRRATEIIDSHNINVLGVVANAVPTTNRDGYGYYNYSSYSRAEHNRHLPAGSPERIPAGV